jgi:hypothetical protein
MNIENQHIGDIFRVLGPRQQQMMLQSPDTPFMYRSEWQCGCAVDYIDAGVGPFHWARCAEHHDYGQARARGAGSKRSGSIASSGN